MLPSVFVRWTRRPSRTWLVVDVRTFLLCAHALSFRICLLTSVECSAQTAHSRSHTRAIGPPKHRPKRPLAVPSPLTLPPSPAPPPPPRFSTTSRWPPCWCRPTLQCPTPWPWPAPSLLTWRTRERLCRTRWGFVGSGGWRCFRSLDSFSCGLWCSAVLALV